MSTGLARFALLAVCAASVFAQEFRATISGRIFDASGAAVAGAAIQATNTANSEVANAASGPSGAYTIPFLRPGSYTIKVTAPGFKTYVRENVTLLVGQIAGIDVTLELGQLTENITVTAESALLETQTASRGGIVDTKQIAELPLNARNPFMLGSMMSGVTFRGAAIWQRPFDNGAIAQWSVNGSQQSQNEFLLDGAPNNGQMGSNNLAYVPIVDAVQEFNVQSNSYDAQYGKTGGGIFNVVLKSGSNSFHATAWEFMRRKALDANTFQGNSLRSPRADHTLDQYGFQLDGPVILPKFLRKESKTRLFYLGSFENYREKTPTPLRNSYAEPEMRTGDFSKMFNAAGQPITIYNPYTSRFDNIENPIRDPFPGNRIPASMISPVARNLITYMPLPKDNTPGFGYSRQNFLNPQYFAQDKFYNLILKFDWNFGDKHRSFFRHGSNDRTEDRAVNGLDNKPGTDGQQPFQRINDAYVLDWVSTLTPTLVFNIRGSYNRFIEKGFGRANEGFDLTSLGLPASLVNALPQPRYFGRWEISGYSNLGRYQSMNFTNTYALMSSLTKIKGPHTLKMGADIRRTHFLQQNTGNILQFVFGNEWTRRDWRQADAFTGDGFATFLLGIPTGGTSNYPLFPFFRNWYMAYYLQDDWKVSRRLTLNLGVRWDANMAPDEKWNRLNRGFDQRATNPVSAQIPATVKQQFPEVANLRGGLQFAGVNGIPTRAADFYRKAWQPRAGFAYSLSNKLVMRGGWGLYYTNPNNDYLQTTGFSTSTPIINSLDGGRTPIPNILSNPFPGGLLIPDGASQGPLTFVGRNFSWYNADFRIPHVHQFSFGFQYQVSRTSTLDFSYVGNRTRDLQTNRDSNLPSLAYRKTCNLLEGGRPAVCDAQVSNPFRNVEAFRGTNFFTANTISRFQLNRPFPQYAGNLTQVGLNQGRIWYNSLQINYNQRFATGLTLLANYTFSKQIEQFGFTDPYADVFQRGLYFLDRPHIFKSTLVYDLPFGRGKKFGSGATGLAQKFIGGWEVTTFYTHQSGEPADLPGNVIQLKDPRVQNIDWKAHQVRGWSPCVLRMTNDGVINPQPFSLQQGCGNDHSNYAWLFMPNYAPRATPLRSGNIRMHRAFTMDASLNKNTYIGERLRVQFGFEAFNVMNHNYFGRERFNTDPNNPNFGSLFPNAASNQNSFPRQIQIRMKLYW
jgi:hypothetical protein